ncbi:uncharacterized protein LOC132942387 [Metopolophium dirhodum]|uniref:uncharacterized protein LOC132942387 n=1 Tax=Metopolophium dirhodum TaxID=44670 RepID=UPI0029900006|nr:uncharacterized protein LOC132942387 [Metopolophium dirhodum]
MVSPGYQPEKCKWSLHSVIKIYGSDDVFEKAVKKLQIAENYSDVNTDTDVINAKSQRRMRAKKKYDSESSSESPTKLNYPVKVTSSKRLKYPNPPEPIASSSTFKMKTQITPTLDNPATSTQRMMTKSPDMFGDLDLLNLSSISNSSELNKIPDLTKTDEHLDDSLLSKLSMELSKIDSLFPTQSIQKISNQRTTIKSSDIMDSEGNDNFEFDDVIKNNKPFSSKNKSKKMIKTSSQCKHDLSVLEDLAEVKVKVQKLLLNQNTILNKLDKLLANNDRSVNNCLQNITSTQINEFEIHFNDNFPLKELTQFHHINDILNNKAYYSLMKKKLLMYGGSSINDVTRHILIKLLTNEISKLITLTGHKGKKTCFASTNYFKVLLEVFRVFYE